MFVRYFVICYFIPWKKLVYEFLHFYGHNPDPVTLAFPGVEGKSNNTLPVFLTSISHLQLTSLMCSQSTALVFFAIFPVTHSRSQFIKEPNYLSKGDSVSHYSQTCAKWKLVGAEDGGSGADNARLSVRGAARLHTRCEPMLSNHDLSSLIWPE